MQQEYTSLLIDGQPGSLIDVRDRGLQYGDGLFETIAVVNGKPCLWTGHLKRLQKGCRRLALPHPDGHRLLQEVLSLSESKTSAAVKIIITRGVGARGYRAPPNAVVNRIVQCSPADTEKMAGRTITARICTTPVSVNPALGGIKSLARLEQVLARSEWVDPEVEEGLMLDPDGNLVAGTMSNLFLVKGHELLTPAVDRSGIEGVMRGLVIDLARRLNIPVRTRVIGLNELWQADSLFVTNSLMGLCPVAKVSDHKFDPAAIDDRLIEQVMDRGFQM